MSFGEDVTGPSAKAVYGAPDLEMSARLQPGCSGFAASLQGQYLPDRATKWVELHLDLEFFRLLSLFIWMLIVAVL